LRKDLSCVAEKAFLRARMGFPALRSGGVAVTAVACLFLVMYAEGLAHRLGGKKSRRQAEGEKVGAEVLYVSELRAS